MDVPISKQGTQYSLTFNIAKTIIKRVLGMIFVVGYYLLINLHLYYFIYYFINRIAFAVYSKPVAIVLSYCSLPIVTMCTRNLFTLQKHYVLYLLSHLVT